MKRSLPALVGLSILGPATLAAAAAPELAKPFLTGDEDGVQAVTGAFGPSAETTVVVTFSQLGSGSFTGFALIPDDFVTAGYRKAPLPKLPSGSMSGQITIDLVANLDKDPADELVIGLQVNRAAAHSTYATVEYVVLDWSGKAFVRVPKLEKQLAAAMKARKDEDPTGPLAEPAIRAALGVPAK